MLTSYFSTSQIIGLIIALVLHAFSVYFFTFKKKTALAIIFLFIGGLTFRYLMISLDGFFYTWDEQYHALVAKHLAENPLLPVLYKSTPLGYDFRNWTANYVWLHKQPLFLWQIALSIKLFGATTIAVRIPSMIMMTLLILVIYRIGKIAFNESVGYLAAFLFATSNFLLEFVTGNHLTDHNDIAFIFYVSLSIWAYTEYCYSQQKKYVLLIGLFTGLAVLNKWLVGLLVFSGWGIVTVFFIGGLKNKIKESTYFLLSLLICCCIFIPWQIYTLFAFPVESRNEFSYNSKHFFEAVENHSGNYWFHFEQIINYYGIAAAIILPLALIFMFKGLSNLKIRVGYIVFVLFTYLFFTLSKTKMPAFCLIVLEIFFLAFGYFLYQITDLISKKFPSRQKIIPFIIILSIGLINADIESIQRGHTNWKTKNSWVYYRKDMDATVSVAKSIKGKYDKDKTVILNCALNQDIQMMFFSDYIAYDRIPSEKEYLQLKNLKYTILFFDPYSLIPSYIKNDTSVKYLSSPDKQEKKKSVVNLLAYNNKFVSDDGSKKDRLFADRNVPNSWETFSLIEFQKDNKCSIRAWTGNFVCADLSNDGELIANREKISEWESFTIVYLDSNTVAFKAFNGKYITCDGSLQLFARANEIGIQEKFKLVSH